MKNRKMLVLGGTGMLGSKICTYFSDKYELKTTIHSSKPECQQYTNLFSCNNSFFNFNINETEKIIAEFKPDIVLNCIGVIKQRDNTKNYIDNIEVNALFPHKLAELCYTYKANLIHFSTDCIFSGKKGNYTENDAPDPTDLYGKTKLLGELIDYKHCLTIRSSIIGLELKHKRSLIEWFLSQHGQINGFTKAIYTGLTTLEMAKVIDFILTREEFLSGLWHVTSSPISKYDLLKKLKEILDIEDVNIIPDDSFVCDRSLSSLKFQEHTGYIVPDWNVMLTDLCNEAKSRELQCI